MRSGALGASDAGMECAEGGCVEMQCFGERHCDEVVWRRASVEREV